MEAAVLRSLENGHSHGKLAVLFRLSAHAVGGVRRLTRIDCVGGVARNFPVDAGAMSLHPLGDCSVRIAGGQSFSYPSSLKCGKMVVAHSVVSVLNVVLTTPFYTLAALWAIFFTITGWRTSFYNLSTTKINISGTVWENISTALQNDRALLYNRVTSCNPKKYLPCAGVSLSIFISTRHWLQRKGEMPLDHTNDMKNAKTRDEAKTNEPAALPGCVASRAALGGRLVYGYPYLCHSRQTAS